MKAWIAGLFAVVVVSGCSTPHEALLEQYRFRVVGIELPERKAPVSPAEIEKIIADSGAGKLREFPVIVAGLGESVTNDQTKSVSLVEDYTVVDGEAVAKEKIQKLGSSVSVAVGKVENGTIGYHLKMSYRELVGFDEYKIENDISVKIPYFESQAIDSDLTQKIGSWALLGGLADQRSSGATVLYVFCMQVVPVPEE